VADAAVVVKAAVVAADKAAHLRFDVRPIDEENKFQLL
jgi:hypothetical protein